MRRLIARTARIILAEKTAWNRVEENALDRLSTGWPINRVRFCSSREKSCAIWTIISIRESKLLRWTFHDAFLYVYVLYIDAVVRTDLIGTHRLARFRHVLDVPIYLSIYRPVSRSAPWTWWFKPRVHSRIKLFLTHSAQYFSQVGVHSDYPTQSIKQDSYSRCGVHSREILSRVARETSTIKWTRISTLLRFAMARSFIPTSGKSVSRNNKIQR